MIKPADIFIGLRDVFGFVIPGIIFCVVVLLFAPDFQGLASKASAAGLGTVSLIGVAYCFGHVFNAIGALVLDWVYDGVQPLLSRRKRFENMEKFGLATDPIKAQILQRHNLPVDLAGAFTRISFWMDYLRLTSPIAAAEIERVESIEKFLRSLCVAAMFAAPVVALPYEGASSLEALAGAVVAAVASFALFVKFRLERCYRVLKLALLTTQITAPK